MSLGLTKEEIEECIFLKELNLLKTQKNLNKMT